MICCTPKKNVQNSINLFEEFFNPQHYFNADYASGNKVLALVSVKEDDHQIYVTTEIPGVDKKDVEVTFQDGILTISGEKKNTQETSGANGHYTEISYGTFSRRIKVGDVNFEEAKAEFENGLLKISLPKAEAKKAKKLLLS